MWCKVENVSCEFDESHDTNCLSGTMRIGDTPLHITAIRVRNGTTCAVDPAWQSNIDAIMDMDEGVENGYELYPHKGHDYFIVIHPYQT